MNQALIFQGVSFLVGFQVSWFQVVVCSNDKSCPSKIGEDFQMTQHSSMVETINEPDDCMLKDLKGKGGRVLSTSMT